MIDTPLISIAVPCYNRPETLQRLIASIDCRPDDIEIIFSDDASPQSKKISEIINNFIKNSKYKIIYNINEKTLGFDGNLRKLINIATGKYILFLGDDDLFIKNRCDDYINFIKKNLKFKYILRSYISTNSEGKIEYFKFLKQRSVIKSGEESVAWLFKRSVTITGFTISRDEAIKYNTHLLDGTLLYQVFLMSQICLTNDSIYYEIPVTEMVQSFNDDLPNFGNAEIEKKKYIPGKISVDNSINFTKSYFEVADFIDKKNNVSIKKLINIELSKYSYPFLSIQRKNGLIHFIKYTFRLKNECNLGISIYFYIYFIALLFLGANSCQRIISMIKSRYGYTPNL